MIPIFEVVWFWQPCINYDQKTRGFEYIFLENDCGSAGLMVGVINVFVKDNFVLDK